MWRARWSMLLVAAIAIALPLAGCKAKEADQPGGEAGGIRAYAGGAYFGLVRARVVPPEGSGIRATSRNGTGSAELEPSGRLVVVGDLDKEADAGFAADGRFEQGAWSNEGGDVQLRIAADGAISGGGIADGNRMTIEGDIDKRKLDLYFEIELLQASAGGFPAGTRFEFSYELWRPFERPKGQQGDTPKGGCREVVYRNKLVPNLSGGAMGMVRVPECRR